MRLAVLGASTPWTVSLIQALRGLPVDLVLQGRNRHRLGLMAIHARAALPGKVCIESRVSEAVRDADMVLVQIRYGGLERRRQGERLAAELGAPADETLGPAALHVAMGFVEPVEELGRVLARCCPDAWILNMINPLGAATAILGRHHRRVIGVCELPHTTASRAARELGFRFPWTLAGLNHRSFLCVGEEVLEALDGRESLCGMPAEWARELGALPTKYHRLVREAPGPVEGSRSEILMDLREQVCVELERAPERVPPSLSERVTDWYEDGVVPLIHALMFGGVRAVNVLDPDGLVRERLARLGPRGIEAAPAQVPAATASWIQRFEAHERAFLEALDSGDREAALVLDPVLRTSPEAALPPRPASARR